MYHDDYDHNVMIWTELYKAFRSEGVKECNDRREQESQIIGTVPVFHPDDGDDHIDFSDISTTTGSVPFRC